MSGQPPIQDPTERPEPPSADHSAPLWRRLWIYQAERFPVAKTALLLAVFCVAGINVTVFLGDRPPPGWSAYAVAWVVTFIIFFQMRVCDEHKDHADDTRYRPERPVPRGLISLHELRWLGLSGVPVAAAVTGVHAPALLIPLAAVWIWLALMTVEFFMPATLKARPAAYLVSHMIIMPLIALLVTASVWVETGPISHGVWLFLIVSFLNGVVLEVGRKLRTPDNEREGVETYSALWGPKPAAGIWLVAILAAGTLAFMLGVSMQAIVVVGPAILLGLLAALFAALTFSEAADHRSQRRIETVSGLWVLLSYAGLGFAPGVAG